MTQDTQGERRKSQDGGRRFGNDFYLKYNRNVRFSFTYGCFWRPGSLTDRFDHFKQNLKKSWHPQTLRNVERVWKAEQKAEAESKKIEQLRKELEEERAREEMQRHAVQQGVAK